MKLAGHPGELQKNPVPLFFRPLDASIIAAVAALAFSSVADEVVGSSVSSW